jgi:hypothetical protein
MNSSFFLSLKLFIAFSSSISISFFFLIRSFSASRVNASVAILNSICSFFLLRNPIFLVFDLLISERCENAALSAILYASLFLANFMSFIMFDLPFFSSSIFFFIPAISLPAAVISALLASCPWLGRCLCAASPWISAFLFWI